MVRLKPSTFVEKEFRKNGRRTEAKLARTISDSAEPIRGETRALSEKIGASFAMCTLFSFGQRLDCFELKAGVEDRVAKIRKRGGKACRNAAGAAPQGHPFQKDATGQAFGRSGSSSSNAPWRAEPSAANGNFIVRQVPAGTTFQEFPWKSTFEVPAHVLPAPAARSF